LAEPEASVARAAVLPEESAAQAVAVLHAVVALRAAARDAAEAPRQEAEVRVGAAVVPRPEAAAQAGEAEAARQPEARDAAGEEEAVLLRAAARVARAVQRRVALPSAVLLAFRRDQPPPWPAP
jgi:hypothetical protein